MHACSYSPVFTCKNSSGFVISAYLVVINLDAGAYNTSVFFHRICENSIQHVQHHQNEKNRNDHDQPQLRGVQMKRKTVPVQYSEYYEVPGVASNQQEHVELHFLPYTNNVGCKASCWLRNLLAFSFSAVRSRVLPQLLRWALVSHYEVCRLQRLFDCCYRTFETSHIL